MLRLKHVLMGLWFGPLAAGVTAAQAHPVWDPATAVWTAAGPGLESSIILGNPETTGSYAIAFRLKPGSWIPPHTHPAPKQVTVLAGALLMGFGPKLDSTTVHAVKAGQITVVPPATAHYEGAKTTTVVVFSGDGPLITTWIKPT